MPLNSSPPVIDAAGFDQKMQAAAGRSRTDFAFWGGLVPGNLDHLEELADRGVVGFKAFMSNSGMADFSHADDLTLYRGMQKATALGLPVAVHAENDAITTTLAAEAVAAGKTSPADYLDSRPVIAELEAIQRVILLAEQTGCRLHIVHVSTAAGVELVRKSAADVSCETCPHYLVLNRQDVIERGAIAKCAPPLRESVENEQLWKALAAGDIPIVASDHSPAPPAMKTDANFFKVWGGIAGVQSTLPILLSHRPALAPSLIGAVSATNPAFLFSIPHKGRIEVGYDADMVLIDLKAEYELKREDLLDRHKFSPYVGKHFRAPIRRTILHGQTIFNDGQIVNPARGRFVRPTR
jgi:allantoinase